MRRYKITTGPKALARLKKVGRDLDANRDGMEYNFARKCGRSLFVVHEFTSSKLFFDFGMSILCIHHLNYSLSLFC